MDCAGYSDCLDMSILFFYPSSIVMMIQILLCFVGEALPVFEDVYPGDGTLRHGAGHSDRSAVSGTGQNSQTRP